MQISPLSTSAFQTAQENISNSLASIATAKQESNSSSLALSQLHSQFASLSQGIQNLNQGMGYLNIADGALNQISQNMLNIEENQVRLGNGALNSSQRKMIEKDIQAHTQAIKHMANTTTYNGVSIFSQGSFSTHDGVSTISASLGQIDATSLDGTSKQNLDSFRAQVNTARSDISAASHKLQSALSHNYGQLNALSSLQEDYATTLSTDILALTQATLQSEAHLFALTSENKILQKHTKELLS